MKMKILTVFILLVVPFLAVAQETTNQTEIATNLAKLEAETTKPDTQTDWEQFRAFFSVYPTPPGEMASRKKWFILSTAYEHHLSPPIIAKKEGEKTFFTKSKAQPGVGRLGIPFETVVTIEGIRIEKGKVGTRTIAVDVLNGIKVGNPIPIWIDNVEHPGLPESQSCVLKGYETGYWIGGNPNQQATWQFFHAFVVTEAVEPTTLKIKKKSQPTSGGDSSTRADAGLELPQK